MQANALPQIDERVISRSWKAHAHGYLMEWMLRGLRCLPPSAVPAFGASLGHLYALRAELRGKLWFKRIQRNILILTPEVTTEVARASVYRLIRNSARVTAEFSVVDRFASFGRVRIVNGENVDRRTGPIFLLVFISGIGSWLPSHSA